MKAREGRRNEEEPVTQPTQEERGEAVAVAREREKLYFGERRLWKEGRNEERLSRGSRKTLRGW